MDRREINTILGSAGLAPQHRYGQNFMTDQNILRAIAAAGEILPGDVVLEVGPGVGNLTRLLSEYATPTGAVITVDIDTKLLSAAQRHHAELTNVQWVQGDVLAGKHELNPEVIQYLQAARLTHEQRGLKLVSNLPYNAASPLVAELLVWCVQTHQQTPPPHTENLPVSRLAFTVQWEVAQRMAAKPHTADFGPLGVLIQLTAEVQILRKIPPGAFWPPPKVNSALVAITPNAQKIAQVKDVLVLQRLLSGIFGHRRQTLLNGLKHYLGDAFHDTLAADLTAAGINLTLRPEALEPATFLKIAELVPTPPTE